MTRGLHIALLSVFLLACGSGKSKQAPPESAGDLTTKARADAVIVAEVNGKPVYGDCVATQVEHGKAATAKEALQQCIDFELLAQEAFSRGYLSGREMIELRKQEAARLFMDKDFATKFSSPADVPENELKRWYQRAKARYVHPEYRKVTYVRAAYTKNTPPGTKLDVEARLLINKVYDGLKGERFFGWKRPLYNLNKESFEFLARRAAGTQPLGSEQSHTFKRWGPVHESFRKPAFEIPAVGMVSPPARTPWGWDIILLEHIEPPKNIDYEGAKDDLRTFLFQSSRGSAFLRWAEQFIKIKTINAVINQQAIHILRQMQAYEDRKNLPPLPTDPT